MCWYINFIFSSRYQNTSIILNVKKVDESKNEQVDHDIFFSIFSYRNRVYIYNSTLFTIIVSATTRIWKKLDNLFLLEWRWKKNLWLFKKSIRFIEILGWIKIYTEIVWMAVVKLIYLYLFCEKFNNLGKLNFKIGDTE